MTQTEEKTSQTSAEAASGPVIHVSPSPHSYSASFTTRRMMVDVLIGLAPLVFAAVYVFGFFAIKQVVTCVASCVAAEMVFTAMRKRSVKCVLDLSAVVTGVILALSIPWSTPAYVGVIAGVMAIGLGKIVFGGLGQNIFNPAMVGRAFVMIAFAGALAAGAYVADTVPEGVSQRVADVITKATPMTDLQQGKAYDLAPLFWGNCNGSLGETSAIACLLGGLYLCLRRTAAWQIPAGTILSVAVIAGILDLFSPSNMNILHHLLGGALLFGAFFIVTDPVSSPITPRGRWIFGILFGATVMLLRKLSNYPEGVMYAVLLVNMVVPLINRWTIPTPVGGPVPEKK